MFFLQSFFVRPKRPIARTMADHRGRGLQQLLDLRPRQLFEAASIEGFGSASGNMLERGDH
jgi:hypothetical protein